MGGWGFFGGGFCRSRDRSVSFVDSCMVDIAFVDKFDDMSSKIRRGLLCEGPVILEKFGHARRKVKGKCWNIRE